MLSIENLTFAHPVAIGVYVYAALSLALAFGLNYGRWFLVRQQRRLIKEKDRTQQELRRVRRQLQQTSRGVDQGVKALEQALKFLRSLVGIMALKPLLKLIPQRLPLGGLLRQGLKAAVPAVFDRRR